MLRKQLDISKENVRAFVDKYGKVATREISEVFGMALEDAEELLETLHVEGAALKVVAGNGHFWLSRSYRQPPSDR